MELMNFRGSNYPIWTLSEGGWHQLASYPQLGLTPCAVVSATHLGDELQSSLPVSEVHRRPAKDGFKLSAVYPPSCYPDGIQVMAKLPQCIAEPRSSLMSVESSTIDDAYHLLMTYPGGLYPKGLKLQVTYRGGTYP